MITFHQSATTFVGSQCFGYGVHTMDKGGNQLSLLKPGLCAQLPVLVFGGDWKYSLPPV